MCEDCWKVIKFSNYVQKFERREPAMFKLLHKIFCPRIAKSDIVDYTVEVVNIVKRRVENKISEEECSDLLLILINSFLKDH